MKTNFWTIVDGSPKERNLKEEEYNNFYLLFCDVNKKENECNILGYPNLFSMFFDSVEDVLEFVLSNERD